MALDAGTVQTTLTLKDQLSSGMNQAAQNTGRSLQQIKSDLKDATKAMNDFQAIMGKGGMSVPQLAQPFEEVKAKVIALRTELDAAKEASAQAGDAMKDMGEGAASAGRGFTSMGASMTMHIAQSLLIRDAVREVIKTFGEAFTMASKYNDLALATGASIEQMQALRYVGDGLNLTIDQMADAVAGLNRKLSSDDSSLRRAVEMVGLRMEGLKALDPVEDFLTLTDAAARLTNHMQTNQVAAAAFGEAIGSRLIPQFGHLREVMAEAMQKSSDVNSQTAKDAAEFEADWKHGTQAVEAFLLNTFSHLKDGWKATIGIFNPDELLRRLQQLNIVPAPSHGGPDNPISQADALKNHLQALVEEAMKPLTAEQQKQILYYDAHHVKAFQYASDLGISIDKVEDFIAAHKKAEQELNTFQKAETNLAEIINNPDWDGTAHSMVNLGGTVKDVATYLGMTTTEVKNDVEGWKALKELNVTNSLEQINDRLQKVGKTSYDDAQYARVLADAYDDNLKHINAVAIASAEFQAKEFSSSIDYQVQKIADWKNAQEGAINYSAANWQKLYHDIQLLAAQNVAALYVDNHALVESSTTTLQQIADKAWTTYMAAKAASGDYTAAAIEHFRELAEAAQAAADGIGAAIRHGILDVLAQLPNALISSGGDMVSVFKQLGVQIAEAIAKPMLASISNTSKAAVGIGAMAGSAVGQAVGGQGAALAGSVAGTIGGAAVAASTFGTSLAAAGIAGQVALAGITMGISLAAVGVVMLIKHFTGLSEAEKQAREAFGDWMKAANFNDMNDMLSKVSAAYASLGIDGETARKAIQNVLDATHVSAQAVVTALKPINDILLQAQQNTDDLSADWVDAEGHITAAMQRIIALNKQTGADAAAVLKFWAQEADKLGDGFNKIATGLANNANQLDFLGNQALTTYAAMIAGGMSVRDAIAKIGPGLDKLSALYKTLGIDANNAAVKALLFQRDLANAAGDTLDGLDGLSASLIAMDNLGMMNADTFSQMQQAGQAMYTNLQAAVAATGGTTKDALLPMQKWLHDAADEAAKLGIPLDDATQILIDQSKELGIWKDKGKTATDILTDAMQKLVDKVSELIDQLTGKLPDAIKKIPPVNVPVNSPKVPGSGDYTPPPPPPDTPTFGPEVFVKSPMIARVGTNGGEYVLHKDTVENLVKGGPYARTAGGPITVSMPSQITVNIPKGTDVNDDQALAKSIQKILRDDTAYTLTAILQLIDRRISQSQ